MAGASFWSPTTYSRSKRGDLRRTVLGILKTIAAVVTLATGLLSLIGPRSVQDFTGLDASGPRGVTEIRAVLGGAFIALGGGSTAHAHPGCFPNAGYRLSGHRRDQDRGADPRQIAGSVEPHQPCRGDCIRRHPRSVSQSRPPVDCRALLLCLGRKSALHRIARLWLAQRLRHKRGTTKGVLYSYFRYSAPNRFSNSFSSNSLV